jgi:hypothetical protein
MLHEKTILREITSSVKEVILTGHSLAGGLAQVAQLAIQGQLQKEGSAWCKLKGEVTVRSIAFAAPMTILCESTLDNAEVANDFLKSIAETSCNIVYGCDVVPHGPGDLEYLNKAWRPSLTDVSTWLMTFLKLAFSFSFDKLSREDLAKFLVMYHHVGKIIYYSGKKPKPVVLRDSQYLDTELPEFRSPGQIQIPGGDIPTQLKKDHSYLLDTFADEAP